MQTSRHGLFPLATLAAMGLAAVSPNVAHADIFTDRTAFTAALGANAGNAYTNTFATFANPYSGNGYTYGMSSPNGIYAPGTFIGATQTTGNFVFTFTSGNVTAVGGNFFGTDFSDAFVASTITLTLDNGVTTTFTGTSVNDFRGFTSTTPILSLTVSAPTNTIGAQDYASIDNLTVGTAAVAPTPEPSQTAALGLGVLGLTGFALKARKRSRVA